MKKGDCTDMHNNPIVINYLVTKDDLYQFASAWIKERENKVERWCCRIIGLAVVIFGLIGAIFLTSFTLQRTIYLLLIFVGLAIGLFYDTLHLYLMKKKTAAYVNHQKCESETLFFNETEMQIQLENYQAIIPYKMLYLVKETEHLYIIKIGMDHIRYVPKRALTLQERERINQYFKTELKENFKREGVG